MKHMKINKSRILGAIFIAYCIGFIYILFFSRFVMPEQGYILSLRGIELLSKEHFELLCNMIPLKTISEYFTRWSQGTMNLDLILANLFGNIVLYLPMGFFIPVLCNPPIDKFYKLILVLLGISVVLECIQFVTAKGSADIDDVILALIGGCLGYLLTKIPLIHKLMEGDIKSDS